MTNDPNNIGDYEEYEEEVNEIEEVDDSQEEYPEPIIEYEDDGYDDEYADEEYYDDEYADEYADEEGYDEDEYGDEEYEDEEAYDDYEDEQEVAALPATQNEDRVSHLLSELDAMRNSNLYKGEHSQGHGVLHSYNLSELSRLRDETLKNNLQNQITYNNSIFSEISRLKDDVTRNQADSRLQYEIMQLRNEMKSNQPASSGGQQQHGLSDEYYREQLRNEIKNEISALKEELRSERAERTARNDIDRLKAQIAQLQKGSGGKSGFNSGEETVGTSFPGTYNNPVTTNYSPVAYTGEFERVFREIRSLREDLNDKIEDVRSQSERVVTLSKDLASRIEDMRSGNSESMTKALCTHIDAENASTKEMLKNILEEIETNAKMSEAKAILSPAPLEYSAFKQDFETFYAQFADIRNELKELSDMTALIKEATNAPTEFKTTIHDISARLDEIEGDLDGLSDQDKAATPTPDTLMAETLQSLSKQLDGLTERLAAIAEAQQLQQQSLNTVAAAQIEAARISQQRAVEAANSAANAPNLDAETAKAIALAAAQQAARDVSQANASLAAQEAQKAAMEEVTQLSEGISNLRTELLSVTNDQSQAINQYMQYIAGEVTTLKTELEQQTQSMHTAIRTVSEPKLQQVSAGLDNDTAEALNAVLNDIRLNIAQNQEAVNRSLAQNLENIKQILSDRSDAAAAAVDRAALMEAVNDLRALSYNQMEATTGGDTSISANDISEIINEINLLRQDVVRQSVAPNTSDDFLQQFGSAVMEDFQYLKDEVAALSSLDQSASIQALTEEFNALRAQISIPADNSNSEAVLSEIARLKDVVAEQNAIMEAQNSIAEGQAAESASQAEAIAAIREAIASLPDEVRLTVADSQTSQPVEMLTQEISVLRAMIEEQTKQIPSSEALDNLAGQINSIRVLIGENPALATDYHALNDLSTEIGTLRTVIEGREYPDNTEAINFLTEELAAVRELIETREQANEMYVEFTEAMEELRAELAAHTERTNENYTEILSATSAALAAAEQAAQAAQNVTVPEVDTSSISQNIDALREELSHRLVPDTFVVMDSLKDFKNELEANLAARDEERSQLLNGQLATLAHDVAEYTAPNTEVSFSEEDIQHIKKEIKSAKDAVLYSIYRDNMYAENMREDLAYLSDQLYYLSENMIDGFMLSTSEDKNKDLLAEINRYVDTLRHDMTNRIMQDADAFNTVSKTLTDLQSELKNITTDHSKAISALNKENAATLKETVSSLKSEFKETYSSLKLDRNSTLSNILNSLKSLRTDLISEVVKGRDIDDKRVLSELSVIKNEIAAARSRGLAVSEKETSSAVTIEDLKSELTGIAEIVKNNKKTTRTTTSTKRGSRASSSKTSSTRSSSPKKSSGGTTRTRSLNAVQKTEQSPDGTEEITEYTVTTTEDITDETHSSTQNSLQEVKVEYQKSDSLELNEVYEYDGQHYTREQLQLAKMLAAKIADKMVVDKLAEQLSDSTVLTVASEMLKNKKDTE